MTGPHADTYAPAAPIFWTPGRKFHPFRRGHVDSVGETAVALTLDGAERTGHARVTFAAPDVVRVQWALDRLPAPRTTEMLAGPVPQLQVSVTETAERIVVDAGGPPVILEREPWRIRFGAFSTEPADTGLVDWVAEPGGWAEDERGIAAYETWSLRPGEELFGTGERFLGPALRGRRVIHWIDTALGVNTTDRVHKSVPLVLSTAGYAVFAHHPEEGVFDLGALSSASASLLVRADELDLFVILGDPKHVLDRYTALTGRPETPPDWSYAPWMSRCKYRNRAEVEEVVTTAAELGIPIGTIGIDPLWLAGREAWGFDACDFLPDEINFGPLGDLVDWLHARDVRLCLWLNPHIPETSPAWDPRLLIDGGDLREGLVPQRGFIDFTGDGGAWWEAQARALVALGVDAFKLDYGEMLTRGGTMADGRRTDDVRNLYPLLMTAAARASGAELTLTRGGTAGSQRYPLHWPGDTQSSWAGLAGAVRGGLAAAWSGFAHWTSDIGGFHRRDLHHANDEYLGFRPLDPELYIRWMQWGMFCSHIRFHGNNPREPWHYGDDSLRVAQRMWQLRRRLHGYLRECAIEATATGIPLLRPLGLERPTDRTGWHVDTQHFLGPDLLVCPVLEPGGRADVYLPDGDWVDVFTGESVGGATWRHYDDLPLDRFPVFERRGAGVLA